MPVYVYMVRCADGSLYSGWTTDLGRRVREHVAGRGAKYTRARHAVALAYYELAEDKSAALVRECALKRLRKGAKEALVKANAPKVKEFTANFLA